MISPEVIKLFFRVMRAFLDLRFQGRHMAAKTRISDFGLQICREYEDVEMMCYFIAITKKRSMQKPRRNDRVRLGQLLI
jgi:hypothetical protein